MRFKYIMIFSFLSLLFGNQLFGQTQTVNARQLGEALNSGDVTLVSANGTGSITHVTGRLRNNTANEIQINVFINNGLYLLNSGVGRNMLALGILHEGGRYLTAGTTRYIRLSANETINILFDSYCTNREKNTPQANESFTRSNMPNNFQPISSRLSGYYTANFVRDITTAVQLGLWRFQGETLADIANIYRFTENDWAEASNILGVTNPEPVRVVPGTYSYSSDYSVTFTGNNFSMVYFNLKYGGSFITIGNTLILYAESGNHTGTEIFTVDSSNAIRDIEGDLWHRR